LRLFEVTANNEFSGGQLESLLEEQENERSKSQRSVRNVDRTVKDLQAQIDRKDKQNGQLQEDMGRMRDKMDKLLKTIEELQASEGANELAARRAERELREEKEKSMQLERELEGLKSMRFDRPPAPGSVAGGSIRGGWRGAGIGGSEADVESVRIPKRKSSISRVPSLTKGFL